MGRPTRRAVLRAGALVGLGSALGVGCKTTGKQSSAANSADARPAPDPENEPELVPPSPERVLARLEVLAAMVVRAEIESSLANGADKTLALLQRSVLVAWCDKRNITDEFEPAEAAFIAEDVGAPTVQTRINASWRTEGVVVLAWALGLLETLPAHDELTDLTPVIEALGFPLGERTSTLTPPRLRGARELDWQARRLLGVHWRLVDYRIRPEPMDFEAFAAKNWFGGFDPTGVRMLDKDLALGDAPIHQAGPDARRLATSIAMERHQAINWLFGFDPIYSQVDIST